MRLEEEIALWTRYSNREQIAKALAILGVHQASETKSGERTGVDAHSLSRAIHQAIDEGLANPGEPLRCRYDLEPTTLHRVPSAKLLAGMWDQFRNYRQPLRIELVAPPNLKEPYDPAWILNQLRLPTIGAESAFVGTKSTTPHIAWRYPVRVGMLTATMRRAYQRIARASYNVRHLTTVIDLDTSPGPVDLLLLDNDLSEALRCMSESVHPIQAHMVAILGGENGLSWAEVDRIKTRISELTLAQAVLITRQDPSKWVHEFIHELSHNEPLDIAANRSGGRIRLVSGGPLLFTSPPLLQGSRVSHFASAMIDEGFNRYDPDTLLKLEDLPARRLGLETGPQRLGGVLENLREKIGDIGWLRERDGASVIASVNRSLEAQIEKQRAARKRTPRSEALAEGPPRKPRYLQIAVFAKLRKGKPRQVTEAFVAGRQHLVDVHIGPESVGNIALRESPQEKDLAAFPEDKLPPNDDGGHLLTIVFFEPHCMKQPMVKSTFLPRFGPTTPCRFHFRVKSKTHTIEGRVTVLHENRVLQTGIVRGAVITSPDSEVEDSIASMHATSGHIDFVLSGAVARASADLSTRSRFDAAIVLNELAGAEGLHAMTGNHARYIVMSSKTVTDSVERINRILDDGLWDLRAFNSLNTPEAAQVLRSLALFGNRIFAFLEGRLSPAVLNAEKLQVVIAHREARFPVEFIYSLSPPGRTAGICPHAAEGLRAGHCTRDCPAKGETVPSPVICPLGFWGFNRVIEWHAFNENRALEFPPNAVARLDDFDSCSRTSEAMIDGTCLYAYSKEIDKADNTSMQKFQEEGQKLPKPPVLAESWPIWKEHVQKFNPDLLLLLVHTKEDAMGTLLEMGPPASAVSEQDYRLGTDYLTREYVYGPAVTGTPIVMLLGCTTARADVPFDTVAAAIEDRSRAGIILATTNLLYGPKAVEIAAMFLRKLAALADGQSFGDVLLKVRQEALADGMLMILSITAYGDADWKLVRHTSVQV